jgi:hypothetical protein
MANLDKILIGQNVQPGISGSQFTPATPTMVVASGVATAVLGAGTFYVESITPISLEFSTDGGTTWKALTRSASADGYGGGMVWSDGQNARIKCWSTSVVTPIVLRVN